MSRGQTQVSWIDQQQQLDSSLGNSSANSIIGRDSPDAKRSKTKAQQSKKFKVSRLMRYSSNDWETDQTFIRELLRQNQLYHHDYNPILDSKQSKIIFNKVLNIDVPKNKTDYDRRFLVKAPDSSLFLQINKSQSQNSRMKPQQVEPTNMTNTNLNFNSSRMDFCAPEGVSLDLYYQKGNKRRTKSQLQKISETNPQDIYDKFTRDYSTDTHAKEHFDIKKQLEHKIKMKESLKLFEKKLFPKSSIYIRKAESIIEIEKQYKEWLQKEKQQNEKQKQEKLREIQEQRQSMTECRQQSAAGQNITTSNRLGRVKQATALRLFSKDLQKINDQIQQKQQKADQKEDDEFSETDLLNQQITIQFTNQNDQTKSSTRAQTQHKKSSKNRYTNLQIQNNQVYEIDNSQSNDILIFQTQPPEISILEENSQFLYDKTPPCDSQEEDIQKINENQEQKNVDNKHIDEFKQKQMQRKNMQKEILNQLLNQSQADSFLNTQESINEQQYRSQNSKFPNHIKHVSTSRLNKSSDGFRINKTSKNNINRRSLITDRLSLKSALESQKQSNNSNNDPKQNRYVFESQTNLGYMDHNSNNIDNTISKHLQYLSFQNTENQKEGQTQLDVNNQECENNRNDQNSSNFSRQQMRIPYEKPYKKSNQSMIKALKGFDEQNDYDMNLSKNDQSSMLLQNKLHLHNRNKSYNSGSTAQVQNVQDVLEQKKIDKLCNYENFFSQNVLKKFKDDNVKMASFIKQTQGFNKNKIWKPDKLVISKKSQVDETSFV
eukprot:403340923